ncbi:MAG TPA: 3-dehydroquinate synthase II, partial [Spirochaetota bacterium]|nr:3-dehydroquinate synthase II [Spirochaetota bacterium]
ISKIKELAKVDVYDINNLPENIQFFKINSKDDEVKASKISNETSLIIETGDWKIIPFENLIAQKDNLFAAVNNIPDAVEAIGILEKGVDGIYIKDCSNDEKINILKKIKSTKGKMELSEGEIVSVEKIITGDRICIDTITNMVEGEGILVGDYSNGMILVNSEALDNPYVASRPFRVNAGAVHCYVMTPNNRTKYLADLKSGDEVLVVNHKGETFNTVIGRIKLEKRPMLRIVIKGKIKTFSVVLQNAETIRVVTPGGKSKSVVALQNGDKVTIFEEKGGRHFGHKIDETIEEK